MITCSGEKLYKGKVKHHFNSTSRWLNSHGNFSYVSHMGLTEPVDDGYVMLSKSAISLGISRLVRDVSKGASKKRIPDLDVVATRFLKGFRDGKYGTINLDADNHTMATEKRMAG